MISFFGIGGYLVGNYFLGVDFCCFFWYCWGDYVGIRKGYGGNDGCDYDYW